MRPITVFITLVVRDSKKHTKDVHSGTSLNGSFGKDALQRI